MVRKSVSANTGRAVQLLEEAICETNYTEAMVYLLDIFERDRNDLETDAAQTANLYPMRSTKETLAAQDHLKDFPEP